VADAWLFVEPAPDLIGGRASPHDLGRAGTLVLRGGSNPPPNAGRTCTDGRIVLGWTC